MNIVVNMRKALNNSQDGRAASYTLDVVSAWAVTVSRPVGPSKLLTAVSSSWATGMRLVPSVLFRSHLHFDAIYYVLRSFCFVLTGA